MKSKAKQLMILIPLLIVGTYFLFLGLAKAHAFLAPLLVAVLLAMLMVPVSNKFELWGLSRGWSSFLSDIILIGFFAGLFWIISMQVQNIASNWPEMKEKIKPKIEQLQQYIAKHTQMSPEEQKKVLEKKIPGSSASTEKSTSSAQSGSSLGLNLGSAVSTFFSFAGSTLLTFVYVFFFLLYRRKFKYSILKFVPEEQKDKAKEIIRNSGKVSQNYLLGKLVLIVLLALLYAIGLSIAGIKHAIFISILAAVLSLLPYVGNIIGFGLAIVMAFLSGGSTNALIGVLITFSIAQFVESYILEPYIVGDKVDLHPVFTIIAVVLGGAVFGIVGMIIAIPIFGIIKVICDRVPVLHPVGYLLGGQKEEEEGEDNFFKKIYRKFKRD